eukprot:241681_1
MVDSSYYYTNPNAINQHTLSSITYSLFTFLAEALIIFALFSCSVCEKVQITDTKKNKQRNNSVQDTPLLDSKNAGDDEIDMDDIWSNTDDIDKLIDITHQKANEKFKSQHQNQIPTAVKCEWLLSFISGIMLYIVLFGTMIIISSYVPWYTHGTSTFLFNNLTMGICGLIARVLSEVIEPLLITIALFGSIYSKQILKSNKPYTSAQYYSLCLIFMLLISILIIFFIILPFYGYVFIYYFTGNLIHGTALIISCVVLGILIYPIDNTYIYYLLSSFIVMVGFISFCDRLWTYSAYFEGNIWHQLFFRVIIYNGFYRFVNYFLVWCSVKFSKINILSITFFLSLLFMAQLYDRFLIYDTSSYYNVFINSLVSGILEVLNRCGFMIKQKLYNHFRECCFLRCYKNKCCCNGYCCKKSSRTFEETLQISAVRSFKMMFMDYVSILLCPIILYFFYQNKYGFTIYSYDDWVKNAFDLKYLCIACVIQLSIQIVVDSISILREHSMGINTLFWWNKVSKKFLKFQLVMFASGVANFLYAFNGFPNDQSCQNLNYCTCLSGDKYNYLCS